MKKENIEDYEIREKILADLEYQLITSFIKLRKRQHLSQQELADASDTIREMVAKIENQIVSPQIKTLIKILEPLGYTIGIVPIDREVEKNEKDAHII